MLETLQVLEKEQVRKKWKRESKLSEIRFRSH